MTKSKFPEIDLFAKGFSALMKGDFKTARTQFEKTLAMEDIPVDIRNRARLYHDLADQRIKGSNKSDANTYTMAVFEKNEGNLDEALKLATKAAKQEADWGNHLVASVHALQGDNEKALEKLAIALGERPELVYNVRVDPDFAGLIETGEYRALDQQTVESLEN